MKIRIVLLLAGLLSLINVKAQIIETVTLPPAQKTGGDAVNGGISAPEI